MLGKKDHVWSLTVGSLYILGVKKDAKRAEQMEGEKERERQNGQMGKCWEGRNYSVRGGVKTLLCKGKKKSLLKRLKGEIRQSYQAIKQRCKDSAGNKGLEVNVRLARHNNSYIIQPIPPL